MTFAEFFLYTWTLGILFTFGAAVAIKDKKLSFGEMIFMFFLWPVCLGVGLAQWRISLDE